MADVDDRPCDSCGTEGASLTLVRRLYVTPEAWDTPGDVRAGDVEAWCLPCLTHYPHQDPDAPLPGADR